MRVLVIAVSSLAAFGALAAAPAFAGTVWVCHGRHELRVDWDKKAPSITVDGRFFAMERNQYNMFSAALTGHGIRYQHYSNKKSPGLAYNELTMDGTTERYGCKLSR